jgi:hypothetical protein
VTGLVQRRSRCLTLDTGAGYGDLSKRSPLLRNSLKFASK